MPAFLKGFNIQMQSFLAALFSTTSCWLWISKGNVPQDLLLINGIVVAFYFGNKLNSVPTPEPLAKPFVPGDDQG